MQQYDALQLAIGSWSEKNFGDQESPYFTLKMEPFPPNWKVNDPMPPTLVAMASLAPLMGIVEELGEMEEATTLPDLKDAVGDVFVYLCDYAARERFALPIGRHLKFELEPLTLDAAVGLWVWVGKLYHGTLKRHQGIRGFDDLGTFEAHRNFCVGMILGYLQKAASERCKESLITIANRTWNEVVQKRDWRSMDNNRQRRES